MNETVVWIMTIIGCLGIGCLIGLTIAECPEQDCPKKVIEFQREVIIQNISNSQKDIETDDCFSEIVNDLEEAKYRERTLKQVIE